MTVRTNNIVLVALIPILLGMVYVVETVMPQVTVTQISSPAMALVFGDRTVVHITDQHLVKHGWRDKMTVSALRRLEPDIIFMTGDYIDDNTDFSQLEDYFRDISSIAPVVASLGNNDYVRVKEVEQACLAAGITLLKNEAAVVANGIDSIIVVGLEDNFLWHDDYFRATRAVPANAPRLVLGHAPAIVEKLSPNGIELILSGHLHGGQVLIPLYGAVAQNMVCFASRLYVEGVYRVNGVTLFSNRGLGTSQLPFRLLSRPEIAVLEFTE